jgi:hypothetical protein
MPDSVNAKAVPKQTLLHGSNQPELLQRVATVYIDGECRVSAPPEAKGDALDWVSHFRIRERMGLNSENEIRDPIGALVSRLVRTRCVAARSRRSQIVGSETPEAVLLIELLLDRHAASALSNRLTSFYSLRDLSSRSAVSSLALLALICGRQPSRSQFRSPWRRTSAIVLRSLSACTAGAPL